MKRITLSFYLAAPWFTVMLAVILQSVFCHGATAGPLEADVLETLVTQAIQPSLDKVAETARLLDEAAATLCDRPTDQNLASARAAWRSAFLSWRRAAPFLIGPASNLDRVLGRWPVNAVVMDAAVKSADLSHMLNDADVRGYSGAEYLLFVPETASEATSHERCAHLLDVTGEIADLTERTREEWRETYGRAFIMAGDGKPFLLPGDALSKALARSLNVTEKMLLDRIGVPSGFFEEKTRAENLEAWRSRAAREGLHAAVEGLRMAMEGDGKNGILNLVAVRNGLVERKNPELAQAMGRQLDKLNKTITTMEAKPGTLYDMLNRKPGTLKPLYKELQVLQDQMVQASLVLELDVRGSEQVAQ